MIVKYKPGWQLLQKIKYLYWKYTKPEEYAEVAEWIKFVIDSSEKANGVSGEKN